MKLRTAAVAKQSLIRGPGVLLGGLLLAVAAPHAACTFYTGTPASNMNAPSSGGSLGSSGRGSGGSSANGGSDSQAGDSAAAGEAGVGAGPIDRGWVKATGSLAHRSNVAPGVVYLSSKPDEDLLIAGLVLNGLWGSSDGGKTWNGLGMTGASDPITNGVNSIVYDPDHSKTFYESGIYTGGGLYMTNDDGMTFKRLGLVTHIDLISVDFSDPKRLNMVAGPHERSQLLYHSADGGDTWDTIGDNLPASCGFSSFPLVVNAKTWVLGCQSQIVRTTDAGASWAVVSKTGGNNRPLVTAEGTVYWGSADNTGLIRSVDDGKNWERVVGGGVILSTHLLELPDGRLVSMTQDYIVVSPDGGVSWQVASPKFPFPNPGDIVYSRYQKAFYVWQGTMDSSIPDDSIMRYDYDYEATSP